jgi:hypothetical protein
MPTPRDELLEIARAAAHVPLTREMIRALADELGADQRDIDAQLWEIAENLHRADLKPMERSEHIAEWVRLTEAKARQPAQVAQAVLSDGRKAGPQHQPSGISAASRELGIDRDKARRAIKIASIADEAKAKAKEYGIETLEFRSNLDRNILLFLQSALEAAVTVES